MKKRPAPEATPQAPVSAETESTPENVIHHHQIDGMQSVVDSMADATRAQMDVAESVRLLLERNMKSTPSDGVVRVKIIRDHKGDMSELILIRKPDN